MKQFESPLYATLLYDVRKKLDISINEYFYLDMVYHLSHDGWCYKTLDNIGDDMGISRIGVVKLRDRLIKKGLIKKSIKGYVKTTDIYNKVIRSDEKSVKQSYTSYNKVTKPYNKVYPRVKQSIPKNNNRITKNNEGFIKYKETRQKLFGF